MQSSSSHILIYYFKHYWLKMLFFQKQMRKFCILPKMLAAVQKRIKYQKVSQLLKKVTTKAMQKYSTFHEVILHSLCNIWFIQDTLPMPMLVRVKLQGVIP